MRAAPAPRSAEGGRPDDPRTRLLEVAIGLFARHGYESVPTGRIAAAAGLSQPMVYYHFGSKEALWRAAIDKLMRELAERYPRNGTELKDLDPVARLKVLTRRFIQLSAGDSRLAQLVIQESLSRSERLDWLVRRYVKAGFADFDAAVEAGARAGLLKDIPAYVVTNTLIGAASLTFCVASTVEKAYGVKVHEPGRVEEMSDGIVEMLFHGIVAGR